MGRVVIVCRSFTVCLHGSDHAGLSSAEHALERSLLRRPDLPHATAERTATRAGAIEIGHITADHARPAKPAVPDLARWDEKASPLSSRSTLVGLQFD